MRLWSDLPFEPISLSIWHFICFFSTVNRSWIRWTDRKTLDYQSDEEVIKDQGSPDSSHTDNVGGAWPLIKPKKTNPRRRFMFVCGLFSREPAQRISSGNQLRLTSSAHQKVTTTEARSCSHWMLLEGDACTGGSTISSTSLSAGAAEIMNHWLANGSR